jgi:SAM-dependent methyltransferase
MNTRCTCCGSNEKLTNKDLTAHWDKTYTRDINELGWYEEKPEPSLRLIKKSRLNKDASILNVGAGATTLVDELLKQGYKNIIANDLSANALEKLQERLGTERNKVKWIIDDLTNPNILCNLEEVDLWHDRAVVHFFTNKKDQDSYFNLLKRLVKKNGFVIIASFNLHGAEKCSGLPVYRFDQIMLQLKLGQDFELRDNFNYTYTMPSGDTREYVYTLYQRIN